MRRDPAGSVENTEHTAATGLLGIRRDADESPAATGANEIDIALDFQRMCLEFFQMGKWPAGCSQRRIKSLLTAQFHAASEIACPDDRNTSSHATIGVAAGTRDSGSKDSIQFPARVRQNKQYLGVMVKHMIDTGVEIDNTGNMAGNPSWESLLRGGWPAVYGNDEGGIEAAVESVQALRKAKGRRAQKMSFLDMLKSVDDKHELVRWDKLCGVQLEPEPPAQPQALAHEGFKTRDLVAIIGLASNSECDCDGSCPLNKDRLWQFVARGRVRCDGSGQCRCPTGKVLVRIDEAFRHQHMRTLDERCDVDPDDAIRPDDTDLLKVSGEYFFDTDLLRTIAHLQSAGLIDGWAEDLDGIKQPPRARGRKRQRPPPPHSQVDAEVHLVGDTINGDGEASDEGHDGEEAEDSDGDYVPPVSYSLRRRG